MFDIVDKWRWCFLLSAIIIVLGLVSLLAFGLRLGIDLAGGALLELQFEQPVQSAGVREVFVAHGLTDTVVQTTLDGGTALIRSRPLDPATKAEIEAELEGKFGPLTELRSESVGPSVGWEVTRAASIGVVIAALAVSAYIAIASRKVPSSLRYGVCAIAAVIHDVLVAVALFSLLRLAFGWRLEAPLLMALLTTIGFSVQETIAVFDRIRENVQRRRGEPFEVVVNRSLLENMPRSLATQVGAILTLIAILLMGGATVKQFVSVLLIGLLSGAYSSLDATFLLALWEKSGAGQPLRQLWRRPGEKGR